MTVGMTGEIAATRRTAGACTPGVNASPDEKAAATTSRRKSTILQSQMERREIKLRFRNKELKSVTVPPDSRTDAPQMILSLHASSGVWSATCARRIASKPPHDAVDSSRGL